ncbi:MAG: tyrosine recombinase, partial [Verrucomicrobia bacterium]|nr:tyrosine recombinase [Verrucomicrobiota bacterium]
MDELIDDFLGYLRHERGQSENTQRTYKYLLDQFVRWAGENGLREWKDVELKHLTQFVQAERQRPPLRPDAPEGAKLSGESIYLSIAALRALFRFAEAEKLLPVNLAENLSLPRRWQRLPKSLSAVEIERLLRPVSPATAESICDQAILELAYAAGLRLSELKNLRLEQLQLEAGFITVIGKGNKE